MNRKLSKFVLTGASLFLSASLAGCGGGGNKPTPKPTPTPSVTPSVTPSPTPTAPEGAVNIEFWHTFGKTPEEAIAAQAKAFQKLVKDNEGVDVTINLKYKGGYSDMPGFVTKALATSDNPTICVAYPDHVADYFAAEKLSGREYVVKLDDYANDSQIGFGKEAYLGDEEGIDDFVEAFIDEGRHYEKEGMYSLPYMKSSEVLFYNMDILRTAMPIYDPDISSDTEIQEFMKTMSWDTFMDLCDVINDNKDQIFPGLVYPAFYDSDGNLMISKILQNNIGFASLDAKGNGVLDFNGVASETFTPSASQTENYNKIIALLTELKENFDKGLFSTKGVTDKYGSDFFTKQQVIFSIGSSGGAGYNFPQGDGFEVGICPVPASNNNPLYVSQGPTLCLLNNYKISSEENAQKVKYAWKFLKFITNTEANAVLTVNGSEGYIPVRQSSYETATFLNFMDDGEDYAKTASTVIYDIDGHYFNTPVFSGSAALREFIGSALADTLNSSKSHMSPKEALDSAIGEIILKM